MGGLYRQLTLEKERGGRDLYSSLDVGKLELGLFLDFWDLKVSWTILTDPKSTGLAHIFMSQVRKIFNGPLLKF